MKKIVLLLCISLLITGCASILSESKYPVTFNSTPSGANIEVKDQYGVIRHSGITPSTAILNSGNGYFTKAKYSIKYSKSGYQDNMTNIVPSVDAWYWGNFLLGGIIGFFIVDPITGAMYEIDNINQQTNLTPINGNTDNSNIDKINQLNQLKEHGILTESEFQKKKKELIQKM